MKNAILKIILTLFLILGFAGWIISFNENSLRALAALLVNYTFFLPLAGGMVVWPAIVRASNGSWMGESEKTAKSAFAFSVPSLIILLVLWITSKYWAPWIRDNGGHDVWLNNTFLFSRDFFLLVVFWLSAFFFIKDREFKYGKLSAGLLCFLYCVVFSFLGFDLVMALKPDWKSNLFGAYFFISGLYIAVAAWTVLSLMHKNYNEGRLTDMAKLILAFCLMTTYMMYSQLLPLWYENIPDQTSFILVRTNFSPWALLSLVVSAVVYVSPLLFLFSAWSKRTPWFLAFVSVVILAGMWMERWWLVIPQFDKSIWGFGLTECFTVLMFLGLFGLSYEWFYSSQYFSYMVKKGNG